MPVAQSESGLAALDTLVESLGSPDFENKVGGQESDVAFLSHLMNDPIVQSLVGICDGLEDRELDPLSCDNIDLVKDVTDMLEDKSSMQARELRNIFLSPHFKALVISHDDVAAKNYEDDIENLPLFLPPMQLENNTQPDAIRMVGIRKTPEEPLGITVRKDGSDLVIARIMTGSMVEKQGLLHIGDIIKEINGNEVMDPDHLQELMKKAVGSVTFKIIPSCLDHHTLSRIFLKTHFTYDPKRDNLIPCRDAGLAFKEGDVLQVLNQDDANWWQAKHVDDNSASGLIPSQTLEEKRKAFVVPDHDYTHKSLLCGLMTKKKKKMMYATKQSSQFDRNDLMIYEEVARMPPFNRKTLVLIGAQGVGRRTLKQRLIKTDPNLFGAILPHTTRPMRNGERDGESYFYIEHEDFGKDIQRGKFLEYGEYEGNYYGTKVDSIRDVIRQGKMCILDLNPQALKAIKTSEFMPYVVFIAAPPVEIMRNMHVFAQQRGKTDKIKTERDFRNTLEESAKVEQMYKSYFDHTIVNDNMEETFKKLRAALEKISAEPQWVPVSWVY